MAESNHWLMVRSSEGIFLIDVQRGTMIQVSH
jgi:hypothetical protein